MTMLAIACILNSASIVVLSLALLAVRPPTPGHAEALLAAINEAIRHHGDPAAERPAPIELSRNN